MSKKNTTLTVETILNTKTVDKAMAERIVKTQVSENLWSDIKMLKMYMTPVDGVMVLRIEYYLHNDLFKLEEETFAQALEREMVEENVCDDDNPEPSSSVRVGEDEYFGYWLEIDEDANMVDSNRQGLYVLPYIALLIEENFVRQVTIYM